MLLEEHIVGSLDEVVYVDFKCIEEAGFKAHVERARAFPLKCAVPLSIEGEGGRAVEVIYFIEVVEEVVVRSRSPIGQVEGLVP